jgi:hypothetical protein
MLMLSFQLLLRLSSSLFSSGFPINILYAFLIWNMRATCPINLGRDNIK